MEAFHRLGAAIASDNTDFDMNQLPPGNVVNEQAEEKLIAAFAKNPTDDRLRDLKTHLEKQSVDPEQAQRIISRAIEILDSIQIDPPAPEETETTETQDAE